MYFECTLFRTFKDIIFKMVDQLAKTPVAVGIPLIFVHDFMLHVRLLSGRITRTLDNNVLASQVAKKVDKERTESKKTILTG